MVEPKLSPASDPNFPGATSSGSSSLQEGTRLTCVPDERQVAGFPYFLYIQHLTSLLSTCRVFWDSRDEDLAWIRDNRNLILNESTDPPRLCNNVLLSPQIVLFTRIPQPFKNFPSHHPRSFLLSHLLTQPSDVIS